MKSRRRWQGMFVALLFVAMSAGAVLAQDQNDAPPPDYGSVQQSYPDQGAQQQPSSPGQGAPQQGYPTQGQQQQDPPGRVARVQYMAGQVSMQPGGVNDWVAASTNRPLTTSDRIWTDKESRAELNVGDGFIRMNSETSLTLTNVSDNTIQLELDQGTLSVTVRHLQPGEIYEVDTPNYAFTLMKSGTYRFDAYPSQDQSWVTVRSGWGQATGKGAAVRVNSGEQVRFTSDQSLQHTAYSAPQRDGFDDWAQVRDKRLDDSVSARYVSPGVIGYQDLDQYGQWTQAPTYGAVWVPNSVPAGWAPYRYGHWAWIAPWGWTWVDDQPWGFAPFHYGRWVSYGGGWGWAPGPYGGYWNPYYAPALVGWIGGPGFGVGLGWGGGWGGFGIGINFGWFPLGWGEPFYPRYCGWGRGGFYRGGGFVSANYFRNVNVYNTHITNINNFSNNYFHGNINNTRFGFRNTAGAVTAAPRSAFTSGAAINRVGGAVPKAELGRASMVRGVDANPTRESMLGGRSPQTHGTPPASAFGRSVVTNARPPAGPARLESNQSAMARGNNAPAANHGMTAEAPRAGVGNVGANRPQAGAVGATRPQVEANGAARTAAPSNTSAGHYVPRPPSAGGVSSPRLNASGNGAASMPAQNVPRPPANNDSFARGNSSAMSNRQPANLAQNHNPAAGNPQHSVTSGWTPQPNWGQTSHPGGAQPNSAPSRSAGSSSTPQGNPRSGAGASSAPRPPAGYSYHAAPASSGSSAYGARSPWASPSGGSSRGSSASSASSNRSSYPSSAYSGHSSYPSAGYGAGRSYSSAPTYSARSYGSMPSSGRSTGSYSAPHYSGGGGASHAPSGGSNHGGGGGSSHSGGGGGHSGGGGHGR